MRWGVTANRCGLSFWGDENALILTMVIVVQYTKYHWTVYSQEGNYTIYKLYLNKSYFQKFDLTNNQRNEIKTEAFCTYQYDHDKKVIITGIDEDTEKRQFSGTRVIMQFSMTLEATGNKKKTCASFDAAAPLLMSYY